MHVQALVVCNMQLHQELLAEAEVPSKDDDLDVRPAADTPQATAGGHPKHASSANNDQGRVAGFHWDCKATAAGGQG